MSNTESNEVKAAPFIVFEAGAVQAFALPGRKVTTGRRFPHSVCGLVKLTLLTQRVQL